MKGLEGKGLDVKGVFAVDHETELTGRCYCGAVEYGVRAEPVFRAQCHCRECQYFTGGHPQVALAVPASTFVYRRGKPRAYARGDLPSPVTREFCGDCGTQLVARSPVLADTVLIRPGTLDDPSRFGQPEIAVFTAEGQVFHHVPEGIPTFARVPPGAPGGDGAG